MTEEKPGNRVLESTVAIADIGMRLQAGTPGDAFEIDPIYGPFIAGSTAPNARIHTRVELLVRFGDPPSITDARDVFDSEGNWKLQRQGDTFYILFSSPVMEPNLYMMLTIDKDFSRGEIHIRNSNSSKSRESPVIRQPLQYPLDEVLMVNLLAGGLGVELHGLGVDSGGRGLIFTGTSGAGKSTLAGLWKQRPEATILSDDRLIVRHRTSDASEAEPAATGGVGSGGGETGPFRLYGTPWHGDAQVSAYGGVSLDRIMVLKQSSRNRLVPLSPVEAAAALLVRCFPTYWDDQGMAYTVGLIGRVCSKVPCCRLEFRPEQGALDTALEGL